MNPNCLIPHLDYAYAFGLLTNGATAAEMARLWELTLATVIYRQSRALGVRT